MNQRKKTTCQDKYLFVITKAERVNKPVTNLEICETTVSAIIDTGCHIDTITNKLYNSTFRDKICQRKSDTTAYLYSPNAALNIIGCFDMKITANKLSIDTTIYVIKNAQYCLLSSSSSCAFNLVLRPIQWC